VSNTAIGVVLGKNEEHKPYSISYVSKNPTLVKQKYIVTKKDILVVVHSINKFHRYITGYPMFIHTNHSSNRYLMNKPITNGRVTRWLLLLQEFDITILDKSRKKNVVVDLLSSLTNEGVVAPVEDNFSRLTFVSLIY
jgi:hypothetical protein